MTLAGKVLDGFVKRFVCCGPMAGQCLATLGYAVDLLCCAVLFYAVLWFATVCHARRYDATLYYAMLCNARLCAAE
eukprot:7101634-Pyramimonas_sp.AAC.1